MFDKLYQLLSDLIFNGNPSAYAYGELICELIPAVLCGALVLLPFIILWKFLTSFVK